MRRRKGKVGTRESEVMRAGMASRSQWAITGALVASGVIAAPINPVLGQGETKRPPNVRLMTHSFSIDGGLLREALAAFSKTTGIVLKDPGSVVGDVESNGVTGVHTNEEALRLLLTGTGVTYRFTNMRTVQLAKGDLPATRTLATVEVAGESAPKSRVSSPKYTQPLRDIPQSIAVVPQDVIKAQGATSLRDIVRNVAGITMNAGEGGATPGDKFNVRGFSASNDMFVDGVRDVSGYSRDAFNIEQIEVSRGPNSAISGRGATGGTINMVTKVPSLRASRLGSLALGSAQQRRATVDINQPLGESGTLASTALRVNAVSSQGGVAGNEVIENRLWGIAPSLVVGAGRSTQVTALYSRTSQDNVPSYGIESWNGVPAFDTRRFYGLRSVDFERVATNQLTLRAEHSFANGARVTNQTVRGRAISDRIVTAAVPSTENPDSARRSSKSHVNDNTVVTNQTNLSTSFRTGAVEHNVATGIELTRERSTWGRYSFTGTAPAIPDLTAPNADADYRPTYSMQVLRQVKASSLAAYAFETVNLSRKVELAGGIRWERYRPDYVDSASKASTFQAAHSSAVTGRAGVVVKPVERASIYASYGTSFDPSAQNLSGDALNASSSLPPERSRSYELGSKWDLFKEKLAATFAIFRTEKVNARTSDPAIPNAVMVLDGKQRVQGAEVSVTGNVSNDWNVLAGYSYMDSKVTASLNPTQLGSQMPNVPKHAVNTWTTYRVSDDLTVGGGARFVDKRLLRNTDSVRTYVPSYQTFDATVSYRFTPTLGLALNIYNLTNKLYYDSGRMWVPAAARSATLTTSVDF
jgi:catecholate siderophore receptor